MSKQSKLRSSGSRDESEIKRLDWFIETVECDGFHCTARNSQKRDITVKTDHAKLRKLSKSSKSQCKVSGWDKLSRTVDVAAPHLSVFL